MVDMLVAYELRDTAELFETNEPLGLEKILIGGILIVVSPFLATGIIAGGVCCGAKRLYEMAMRKYREDNNTQFE